MKLVVNNTDWDIQDYEDEVRNQKIGEQSVRYACPTCLSRKMIKVSEIDSYDPRCKHCKKHDKS